MRIRAAVMFAVAISGTTAPRIAGGQTDDSLRVGDRIRVRSYSTEGTRNLFVGNLGALSRDTLTIALPGERGAITLPRLAISEIAISAGRESRSAVLWRHAPILITLPLTIQLAARAAPSSRTRLLGYTLLGLEAYSVAGLFSSPRLERWRPVTSWLER